MTELSDSKLKSFILFSYTWFAGITNGWQVIAFSCVYFNLNELLLSKALNSWFETANFLLLAHLLTVGLAALNYFLTKHSQLDLYTPFLLQSAVGTLVIFSKFYFLDIIQLIIFALSILTIYRIAKVFYNSTNTYWKHPVTYGSFFITALLNGISILIVFNIFPNYETEFIWLVLAGVFLTVMILISHFRYLGRNSVDTNRIAKQLLTRYVTYFGTRVIIGIFMPVGYGIYALYFNPEFIKAMAVSVLIGEMLDRIIYVYVGRTVFKI